VEILWARSGSKPDQQFRKVVVSRHMIDAPDRFEPRFPQWEGIVREQLKSLTVGKWAAPGSVWVRVAETFYLLSYALIEEHVKLFIALPEESSLRNRFALQAVTGMSATLHYKPSSSS